MSKGKAKKQTAKKQTAKKQTVRKLHEASYEPKPRTESSGAKPKK